MKIILTIAEITALVISRYNLPEDITLEIEGIVCRNEAKIIAEKIVSMHRAGDCLDTFGNVRPDKKIAAIKLLREFVQNYHGEGQNNMGRICGLAQAKFAVEDYQRFLDYVSRFGLPAMGTNDPEYGWVRS